MRSRSEADDSEAIGQGTLPVLLPEVLSGTRQGIFEEIQQRAEGTGAVKGSLCYVEARDFKALLSSVGVSMHHLGMLARWSMSGF